MLGSRDALPTLFFTFGIVALVFGVANGLVKPVVKILSLPATLLTLGLAGIVLNAVLFLSAAWVSNQMGGRIQVGDYPPDLLTQATLVAALIGSIVVGVVSAVARMVENSEISAPEQKGSEGAARSTAT